MDGRVGFENSEAATRFRNLNKKKSSQEIGNKYFELDVVPNQMSIGSDRNRKRDFISKRDSGQLEHEVDLFI